MRKDASAYTKNLNVKQVNWKANLLHDTSLALRESDVPPRLALNKFDLDFPTTGHFNLWPTLFFFLAVVSTVDGIVVLDEAVVADGREAVVPGVGTRTLTLYRRGGAGCIWRKTSINTSRGRRISFGHSLGVCVTESG